MSETKVHMPILCAGIAVLLISQIWGVSLAWSQDTHIRSLRDLQEAFRSVAKSVKPAVVNVSTVRVAAGRQFGSELDPFFENHPFREFFGDEFFRRFFGQPGGTKSTVSKVSDQASYLTLGVTYLRTDMLSTEPTRLRSLWSPEPNIKRSSYTLTPRLMLPS